MQGQASFLLKRTQDSMREALVLNQSKNRGWQSGHEYLVVDIYLPLEVIHVHKSTKNGQIH